MYKKSAFILSWQSLCLISKTSSSRLPLGIYSNFLQQPSHPYAVVSGGHVKHDHSDLRWPEVTSAMSIPTPYQIFNQKKGAPYSKKRFYELVKLYHPDRHDVDHTFDDLSYNTKLERYRLVVAANDILSDPVKRGAYDCYGAGWNGQPSVLSPSEASESTAAGGGRGWGGGPMGPSQNATWEDWEKWYQRDSQAPQEPRFVSNTAFVGLILTFALLGGIGQAARAGAYGSTFIEQRDALHGSISKDLVHRRRSSRIASAKEERIEEFVRNREPMTYALTDATEEAYRKLLPAPEVCSSGDIKGRPTGIYHEKGNPKDG